MYTSRKYPVIPFQENIDRKNLTYLGPVQSEDVSYQEQDNMPQRRNPYRYYNLPENYYGFWNKNRQRQGNETLDYYANKGQQKSKLKWFTIENDPYPESFQGFHNQPKRSKELAPENYHGNYRNNNNKNHTNRNNRQQWQYRKPREVVRNSYPNTSQRIKKSNWFTNENDVYPETNRNFEKPNFQNKKPEPLATNNYNNRNSNIPRLDINNERRNRQPTQPNKKVPLNHYGKEQNKSNALPTVSPRYQDPRPQRGGPVLQNYTPSPRALLSEPRKDPMQNLSPRTQYYNPLYKSREEPELAPLRQVGIHDYDKSLPVTKMPSQKAQNIRGNPLVPVMIPMDYKNYKDPTRLGSMSPAFYGSETSLSPRISGVPTYKAVGKVLTAEAQNEYY